MANVDVGAASVRDYGIQFIGNTTIGAFHQGAQEDDKAQRRWKDVISWLSPSDEALKLQDFIENEARSNHKLDKAGSWFIENESFQNWIEGRSKRIWVNGAMGCGKTVLFLLAVEEVRKICLAHKQRRLAYFYCTSRNPLGQDIVTLFRSLLRQFCTREIIPIPIQTLLESCDQGIDRRPPSIHELASCLKEVISISNDQDPDDTSGTIFYLLLDGLDELAVPTMDELLNKLKPIVSSGFQHVHVLFVSRNHKEIEISIDDAATWDKLPLDPVCVQEDIEQFVLSEIAASHLLRRLPQDIQFRWAFLQMQSLKALKPPVRAPKVREKLNSLPETLDATYDEMLHSLDDCDQPLAWRALRWLVFSSRPLYLEELIDALSIDLEAANIISDRLHPLEVEALLKDLIQVHPPLSQDQEQILHRAHRVVLAHASIQEYLLKVRKITIDAGSNKQIMHLEFTKSNIILAQCCLAYLLCFNTYDLRHRRQEYPLLRYAWYHWEQHFTGPESHCVRTLSSTELRRKAPKILALIKKQTEETSDGTEICFDDENNDLQYFTTFRVIVQGVRRAAQSYQLDLSTLPEALNIPYFHPAYDDFCPSDSLAKHSAYKDLIDPKTWIRLLETLPAIDPKTPVSCRLVTCKLEDAPPYAALSYSWGDYEESDSIILEGQELQLKPSQFLLLQSMRSRVENENPAVWMDFVCINYKHRAESGAQIPLIPTIFRQAREAVVFLETEANEEAVHQLAKLASAAASGTAPRFTKEAYDVARNTIIAMEASRELHNILNIFKSRWWMISWIIQEIVFATKAVVLLKNISFNLEIIEQVTAAADFIQDALKASAPTFLRELQAIPGWQIARQIVCTRIEYQQGRPIELPTLIWRFRHTQTSYEHDKLFSLLPICLSDKPHSMCMDRSQSSLECDLEVSYWFLHTYQTLDFLDVRSAYEPGGMDNNENSWILPFWNLSGQRHPLDLGIFRSIDQTHIYAATGTKSCTMLVPTNSRNALGIRGLTFDKIDVQPEPHCPQSDRATSPESWLTAVSRAQAAISEDGSIQETMEARWRTVTANQWPLGEALSAATLRGIRVPPETEEEEQALLQMIDTESDLPLLHGRRLIISYRGRLGLVPEEFEEGDLIVLLTGGSTPYIMRRLSTGQYRFIGSSYIHGCMNGEVIEALGQNWYTETFEII